LQWRVAAIVGQWQSGSVGGRRRGHGAAPRRRCRNALETTVSTAAVALSLEASNVRELPVSCEQACYCWPGLHCKQNRTARQDSSTHCSPGLSDNRVIE